MVKGLGCEAVHPLLSSGEVKTACSFIVYTRSVVALGSVDPNYIEYYVTSTDVWIHHIMQF
jgi:hypothetical protein